MGFREDWQRAVDAKMGEVERVHSTAVELAKQSIQFGSTATGSPGQPVQTGNLLRSWLREDESPLKSTVSTNVVYAQPIEDGVGRFGPLTLRSDVGGFHSVAQTTQNFDRLVGQAVGAVNATSR